MLSSLQMIWHESAHLSHALPGLAFLFHASYLPAWAKSKNQMSQSRTEVIEQSIRSGDSDTDLLQSNHLILLPQSF